MTPQQIIPLVGGCISIGGIIFQTGKHADRLDLLWSKVEAQEFIENEIEDHLVDPMPEDSTELGDVPEEPKKGSITPYRIRRYLSGYGYY